MLGAAALQARGRPWLLGGVAYLWGWLDARRRRVPRAPLDIRRAKRAEQRRRAGEVLRRQLRRPAAAVR